jgi:hypothetical protein
MQDSPEKDQKALRAHMREHEVFNSAKGERLPDPSYRTAFNRAYEYASNETDKRDNVCTDTDGDAS